MSFADASVICESLFRDRKAELCLFEIPFETEHFWREFSRRGFGWGFCIVRGVISKQIIELFFFVVFELA